MTITSTSFRWLVIYVLTLPAAVIMGITLADKSQNLKDLGWILVFVLAPLILKWSYPILLLSWNATAIVFLIPGQPQLWAAMSALGVTLAILKRCLFRDVRFISAPSVVLPVLAITGVVIVIASHTGGFGVAAFGGQLAGGRHYFLIMAATLGFLTMLANPIPEARAGTYTAFFFLGSLTNFIGSMLAFVPPSLYYLFLLFPVDAIGMGAPSSTEDSLSRFFGLAIAVMGAYYYLLARFGVRELFRKERLHIVALLGMCVLVTCLSGFRSFFILLALTFVAVAYFEGLVRSKYSAIGIMLIVLSFSLLSPFANRLPLSIQRTLSVLTYVVPLDLDPASKESAEGSTKWRWEMWKELWHKEVPEYWMTGKGLVVSAYDLTMMDDLARVGGIDSKEFAIMAGNYHNGGLTLLIPFGIWGLAAWLWFIVASIHALHRNYKFGAENLKKVNTFLLAFFIAKTIYFFAVFGDFRYDFPFFVGIVGFSLSLNRGICKNPLKQPFVPSVTNVARTPVRRFAGISRGAPRPVRS